MVADREYVRVCPVCGTQNAPALVRCACGAVLAGVDFSLRPDDRNDAGTPGEAGGALPAPVANAAGPVCLYPDCAQPNPPGHERCAYCNRPLNPPAAEGARPLPAPLRDKYRVLEAFPASGAEADLMLVQALQGGAKCVAKLYRRGIQPDFDLLAIVAKSAGDAVVRVLEYGVADGVAYEVLEYMEHGTLQEMLQAGALASDDVRQIVAAIADALNVIHAHRILHRDLKPANVMLRSRVPLQLALGDFGIASLAQATQHFTTGARTTQYAAPEALTGMIVLEAATGRHPFEGLSEQVMNHHLATRPIDVRGVRDDDIRRLCRGLLLRDPKRRWGGDEVARWLRGDTTLPTADDGGEAASAVQPYRIGPTASATASELAVALATEWAVARTDLTRGQVGHWIEHELRDYNLLRKLRDIEEQRGLSDDGRLLRFLLAAAPDLPPVWQGRAVTGAALFSAARRAAQGDEADRNWLASLYAEEALSQFAASGHKELGDIDGGWRQNWARFCELWQAARDAEERWRKQPRPVAGVPESEVVDFDDLVYTPATRLALPARRTVDGALLLAHAGDPYVDALRQQVIAGLAKLAGLCPWAEAVWEEARQDAVGAIVMERLMPRARDDAELEARRQAHSHEARLRIIAATLAELRERAARLLAVVPDDDRDFDRLAVAGLLQALPPLQETCQKALALGFVDKEAEALTRNAEALSSDAAALHLALSRYEHVQATNAIFTQPGRLLAGAGVLAVVVLTTRMTWLTLVFLIALLTWLVQRWYAAFDANATAKTRLGALRRQVDKLTRPAPREATPS